MSAYEGDAAAIGKLIWTWGEAYIITYANGLYHAERRDNGARSTRRTPEQLDQEIQSDYTARPVPRDLPGRPVLRPGHG